MAVIESNYTDVQELGIFQRAIVVNAYFMHNVTIAKKFEMIESGILPVYEFLQFFDIILWFFVIDV